MRKRLFTEERSEAQILCALLLLSAVSYLLPAARYVYQKTNWHISSLDYFRGISIAGGDMTIAPQRVFAWGIVALVILIAAAVCCKRVSKRVLGLAIVLGGVLQCVAPIVFMYGFNSLMRGSKQPAVQYGVYVVLILGVLVIAYGASVWYRHGIISMLDLMIIPGLAYLIINNYLPMSGILLAFKKLNLAAGLFKSPWNGLKNFQFLFQSSDAWYIIRNTLAYNFVFILLGNVTGIIVGILLSEAASKFLQRSSQTLILLPQLISWVIVSYMVYGLLATDAGWINKTLLPFLGYDGTSISFYGIRKYWPFILTILSIWKGLGYNAIIYFSAILSIDRNLYEAASIDGCGKIKQIFHITLPLLRTTFITLLILGVGRIMYSDFGLFYQIPQNSGALYRVTQTLDVYVYRAIMETQNLGMGSAAAAFQSVCGFVLVLGANALVRKIDSESAMF